jgi:hypothetical protein
MVVTLTTTQVAGGLSAISTGLYQVRPGSGLVIGPRLVVGCGMARSFRSAVTGAKSSGLGCSAFAVIGAAQGLMLSLERRKRLYDPSLPINAGPNV